MRDLLRWAGRWVAAGALIGAAVVTPTTAHAAAPCDTDPARCGVFKVTNPYSGAQVYVDPQFSGPARAQAAQTPGPLGHQMARVATYPTAVWLDSIGAVTSGQGLTVHLDAALAQRRRSGAGAMVVQLVLYDIPGRDCFGRAAPGELTLDAADQQRYRTEFVDRIVEILQRPRYAALRVVTIVEPGALSDVAFSPPNKPLCAAAGPVYVNEIRYVLSRLGALPNAYPYLDFTFSGSFSYAQYLDGAAGLYADVVGGAGGPGVNTVTGFVTDVRQYVPLVEPFIPSAETVIGGRPVYQSRFYDWNRQIAESSFAQAARTALIGHGFPPQIGMLIDTARNGWGGPDRPTGPSTSDDVDVFVDQSRIDRRPTRDSWCNQAGAGLGARPQANPAPGIHAYAWVTRPGVSDGVADAAAPPDPDRPYLSHRPECDPDWLAPWGSTVPTNALPGAPHAGRWFPEFFAQLVSNAYPPVPGG